MHHIFCALGRNSPSATWTHFHTTFKLSHDTCVKHKNHFRTQPSTTPFLRASGGGQVLASVGSYHLTSKRIYIDRTVAGQEGLLNPLHTLLNTRTPVQTISPFLISCFGRTASPSRSGYFNLPLREREIAWLGHLSNSICPGQMIEARDRVSGTISRDQPC